MSSWEGDLRHLLSLQRHATAWEQTPALDTSSKTLS